MSMEQVVTFPIESGTNPGEIAIADDFATEYFSEPNVCTMKECGIR